MSLKTNCWEAKTCERGPDAPACDRCPAAVESRTDGVHGGINGGRACWVVAGTLCSGRAEGTYARKVGNCMTCDFYRRVRAEEGDEFVPTVHLIRRMGTVRVLYRWEDERAPLIIDAL